MNRRPRGLISVFRHVTIDKKKKLTLWEAIDNFCFCESSSFPLIWSALITKKKMRKKKERKKKMIGKRSWWVCEGLGSPSVYSHCSVLYPPPPIFLLSARSRFAYLGYIFIMRTMTTTGSQGHHVRQPTNQSIDQTTLETDRHRNRDRQTNETDRRSRHETEGSHGTVG